MIAESVPATTEKKPAHVPAHVAIIMDGNGRWAAQRGLSRQAGHRAAS
jgi:undecaprenyl diphosphate synthase